jgi:zinc/manganese transport system substrate-binding protein
VRPFAAAVLLVTLSSSACAALGHPHENGTSKVQVVVAENVWGTIAAELGGDRVDVTSIIASPDIDPHSYEPTARDERAIAASDVVIFNVGAHLGLRRGDDPHRWYHPDDVDRVIAAITDAYTSVDPNGAAFYAAQRTRFESQSLSEYHALLSDIRQRFAGTPVGATETVFSGIAEATGLDLVTPAGFLTAIAEGTDPSADDKATVDEQIKDHRIAVLVVNAQNATPDVHTLEDAARANGIDVVSMTETVTPAGATFEEWQAQQLRALRDALTRASGQ